MPLRTATLLLAALALAACSAEDRAQRKARAVVDELQPRIARGEINQLDFDVALAEAGVSGDERMAAFRILKSATDCISLVNQLYTAAASSRSAAAWKLRNETTPPSLLFSYPPRPAPTPTPLDDLRDQATATLQQLPTHFEELVAALRLLADDHDNTCINEAVTHQITVQQDEYTHDLQGLPALIAAADRPAVESGHRQATLLAYWLTSFTADVHRYTGPRNPPTRDSQRVAQRERRQEQEQLRRQRAAEHIAPPLEAAGAPAADRTPTAPAFANTTRDSPSTPSTPSAPIQPPPPPPPQPPTIAELRADATAAATEVEALHDQLIGLLEAIAAAADDTTKKRATDELTLARFAKRQEMSQLRSDIAADPQWRIEGALRSAALLRTRLQAQIATIEPPE